MPLGNIYQVDVSTAFAAEEDQLQSIRDAIRVAKNVDNAHTAKIMLVDMRSESSFTVMLNRMDVVTAVKMPSGEYGVTYIGGIDRVIFTEEATLTWFQVQWAYAGAAYSGDTAVDKYVPDAPGGTEVVTVTDNGEGLVTVASTDSSFYVTDDGNGNVQVHSTSANWNASDDGAGEVILGQLL